MFLLPDFSTLLLTWYSNNARSLPWREQPTPYRVWISEIMLQQTRVEAVKPYFFRFLDAFPDLPSLAAGEEGRLMKLWEGLGYYIRARNLQKAARQIVMSGGDQLPGDYHALLALPGIGSYTAGAIASIGFSIPVPAVDGNVLRVCARLAGSEANIDLPSTKTLLEKSLLPLIPKERPGDFNQALMELGATVCLPNGAPQCLLCPLKDLCIARKDGSISRIPVRKEKKARRMERKTVLLLCFEGKIALQKRPPTGLLAGLWEFPWMEGTYTEKRLRQLLKGLPLISVRRLPPANHIFTHIEWQMSGYLLNLSQTVEGFMWAEPRELKEVYAIPTAYRAFIEEIEKGNVL